MDRAYLEKQFLLLKTERDLTDLLEIELYKLIRILFEVPSNKKYRSFSIKKRSGGERVISAPSTALITIQHRLHEILCAVYVPRAPTHGFVQERSIVTNAQAHSGRRWVFNLDLANFFPSIHFGRVRGVFMAAPYNLPRRVANFIAHICCLQRRLPQGAPTHRARYKLQSSLALG